MIILYLLKLDNYCYNGDMKLQKKIYYRLTFIYIIKNDDINFLLKYLIRYVF